MGAPQPRRESDGWRLLRILAQSDDAFMRGAMAAYDALIETLGMLPPMTLTIEQVVAFIEGAREVSK